MEEFAYLSWRVQGATEDFPWSAGRWWIPWSVYLFVGLQSLGQAVCGTGWLFTLIISPRMTLEDKHNIQNSFKNHILLISRNLNRVPIYRFKKNKYFFRWEYMAVLTRQRLRSTLSIIVEVVVSQDKTGATTVVVCKIRRVPALILQRIPGMQCSWLSGSFYVAAVM